MAASQSSRMGTIKTIVKRVLRRPARRKGCGGQNELRSGPYHAHEKGGSRRTRKDVPQWAVTVPARRPDGAQGDDGSLQKTWGWFEDNPSVFGDDQVRRLNRGSYIKVLLCSPPP